MSERKYTKPSVNSLLTVAHCIKVKGGEREKKHPSYPARPDQTSKGCLLIDGQSPYKLPHVHIGTFPPEN